MDMLMGGDEEWWVEAHVDYNYRWKPINPIGLAL